MKNAIGIIGIIVLLIILMGLGPILTLMALNTLFQLGIAYNFYTWISVVWLGMVGAGIIKNGTRN